MEKSISVLSLLEVDLLESSLKSDLEFQLEQMKLMLSNLSEEDLLNDKIMTDPSKIMAIKFLLNLIGNFFYPTRYVAICDFQDGSTVSH